MTAPAPRWCSVCGRIITWRKKWARDWERVRYCSRGCRRARLDDTDRALEQHLRDTLSSQRTADPRTAAEAVAVAGPDLRERSRNAARRLVAAGEAVAVQRGRTVDASTVKGPFILRAL